MDGPAGESPRRERELTPDRARDARIGHGRPRPEDLTGAELADYLREQQRVADLQSTSSMSDVMRTVRSLAAGRPAIAEARKPLPELRPPKADREVASEGPGRRSTRSWSKGYPGQLVED